MEDTQKTQLFEETPVSRAVMTLAVPTILSSLVMVFYHLADTYFVGMLSDPIQNAALTLSGPVLLAFNAVNNLFGVGSSSMMSRALGSRDYDTVYRSSAFGFYGALFCGILFSVLYTIARLPLLNMIGTDATTLYATGDYLFWTVSCGAAPAILNVVLAYMVRSEGSALHASIGTMSGCLLNIILDPFFILPWGLNMGAAGAGLATFLSNCVACLYFFVLLYVKRGRTYVCIKPSMLCFRQNILLGVCGVGIPASIQNLLNVTGRTVLNNFASAYGSEMVAAIGIASTICSVPMQIFSGLSQGVMPLISYNFASGNIKRMKQALLFTVKLAGGFMVLVTVGYYLGARGLTWLFIKDEAVIGHGVRFLRAMCLAQPFLGMDFIAVGVFQACGMGKKSLIFAILRKIILEIPILFVLDRFFPPYGIGYSQFVAEVILAVVAVVILRRLFRGFEQEQNAKRA